MSPPDYEPVASYPSEDPRKSVNVSLDSALVELLDNLAQSQRVSRSEIANQLLGLAATEREKIQTEQEERKVTISVRVKKSHAERLKNLASIEGESINGVVAQIIESAMKSRIDNASAAAVEVLQEQLQEVIEAQREEIKKQMHRHAHLLSRSVLENLQNRQMMLAILQAQGIPNEDIQKLSDVALHRSIDQLKHAKPMMRDALRDFLGGDLIVVKSSEYKQEEEDEGEGIEYRDDEIDYSDREAVEKYISELDDADYQLEKQLEIYRDMPDAYEIPEFMYLKNQQYIFRGKIAEIRVKLYELEHFESDDDEEYEEDEE